MRRACLAGMAAFLSAGLVVGPVAARVDVVDRIDLPNGWSPEGITTLGGKLYIGSLADGAIWVVDPSDPSSGHVFAEGEAGRVSVGIEADAAGQTIWAAGGRSGEIRAYDVDGAGLTSWIPAEGFGFYNDIVVTEDGVYVTDSFIPQLAFMPLFPDGPPDSDRAQFFLQVPLSGDLEHVDGAFNANGIVAAPGGLIVVQSTPGALFRVECEAGDTFPEVCETFAIDIGDIELSGGDGLELDGFTLYVVRGSVNMVTVLQLDEALTSATLVSEIRHEDFDTPTTAALLDGDLWVVNARFGAPASPDTEYWLTRVDAVSSEDG